MPKGGPIRSHSTDTSRGQWSGPGAEAKLGDAPGRDLRKAYAWVDPDGDPDNKGSYKFKRVPGGAAGQG